MKTFVMQICVGFLLATASSVALAQAPTGDAIPVTADNFIRAETDRTFAVIERQGGFSKFMHFRELSPIDNHTVKRANRDTLYSVGVFDLDAGPVTISLPDAGSRFMTMIVIDEDHYVFTVVYGTGSHTSPENRSVRATPWWQSASWSIRTIRRMLRRSHTLQDAIKVEQPGGPSSFEVPNWDQASQKKVRDALVVLGETIPDWRHAAGRRNAVDPVRHLIVTATGWGLNPDKDAMYLNVTPSKNDGTTIYRLNVKDVPVDGFWSISLYNADGYFEPNNLNAYTLNNITAKKAADGSVAVQFGGCDGKIPNCLPIVKGWNYMVRLYRPQAEILNGTWKFPEARPVN